MFRRLSEVKIRQISIENQIELYKRYRSTIPSDIKQQVLEYLKNGYTLAYHKSCQKDRIDESKGIAFSDSARHTDGEWAWSTELIYYLERYDIPLPEDFISHMENSSWTVDREKAKYIAGLS